MMNTGPFVLGPPVWWLCGPYLVGPGCRAADGGTATAGASGMLRRPRRAGVTRCELRQVEGGGREARLGVL
jgi:hypothetical protein